MLRTLTEQEVINSQHDLEIEMNTWWFDKLTHHEKNQIYHYHKNLFEQAKCIHSFVEIDFYSKKCKNCINCGFTIYPELEDSNVSEQPVNTETTITTTCHCGGGSCGCTDENSNIACGCGDKCACSTKEPREATTMEIDEYYKKCIRLSIDTDIEGRINKQHVKHYGLDENITPEDYIEWLLVKGDYPKTMHPKYWPKNNL